MADPIATLLELTRRLGQTRGLDVTLQSVVECALGLVGAPRVSIRLIDPTHARLIATCRAGKPLHHNATTTYQLGQGLLGWIAKHKQPLLANDAMADVRFIKRPDMIEPMGSYLGVPIVANGEVTGVLSAVSPERLAFTAEHQQLLELIAGIASPHIEVGRMAKLAQVDSLTGALNRRGLDAMELDGPVPFETPPFSVVMADVDHFKQVNDALGHAAGDECLRRVARVLGDTIREVDALVRYGGEEFLLVLLDTELAQAARVAERGREAVESAQILNGRKLTISAGVAQQRPNELRQLTVARADGALLEAKRQGRNRVVLA
ncbi:MAG: GGDEF domain-containing protein [Myxococcaceae bacterium]|nr:GGDEF domain-containing protein [Myxococcaceae bacterium]